MFTKVPRNVVICDNIPNTPLVMQIRYLRLFLNINSKKFHHRVIVRSIVTSNMSNLPHLMRAATWTYQIMCTCLVSNPKSINNFKKSTTQSLAVVCVVESYKAKKSTMKLPNSCVWLFDPVSSDSKITVCVWRLPSIAREAHLTLDNFALPNKLLNGSNTTQNKIAYVEALLEMS